MRGEKGSYFIRIIVAAYLIYLGVKLIRDMLSGKEAENPTLFIIIGIAFIAISIFLIVYSVKGIARVQKEEAEAAEEEARAQAEEKQKALEEAAASDGTVPEGGEADAPAESGSDAAAPEEIPAGPMSISDRIRLLSEEPEESPEEDEITDVDLPESDKSE